MPVRILVVQDKPASDRVVHRALSRAGYAVELCSLSSSSRQCVSNSYDLIVLGGNGRLLCRALRQAGQGTPLLMLADDASVEEKVAALDEGVDDYATTPFHVEELLARVRVLLRRRPREPADALRAGALVLHARDHEAFLSGRPLHLTAREFSLLSLLVRNAGHFVARTEIMDNLWDASHRPDSNVVDVHVRNIRLKLGVAAGNLQSARGRGYRYRASSPIDAPD